MSNKIPSIKKEILRVAAYCRVSTVYEEQQSSLNALIQYYTDYINNHDGWILAGIYFEQASGTRFDNRDEFNRILKIIMRPLLVKKFLRKFNAGRVHRIVRMSNTSPENFLSLPTLRLNHG
ncbi:MAG TPA: recombinase family protein [Clostridiales bacterium]|nr:recombinase family protein [Clostridiales bacterium]